MVLSGLTVGAVLLQEFNTNAIASKSQIRIINRFIILFKLIQRRSVLR
jgi:hypothetical protein